MRLIGLSLVTTLIAATFAATEPLSLNDVVLIVPEDIPAVVVETLTEEWAARAGAPPDTTDEWPDARPGIRIERTHPELPHDAPALLPEDKPEAYAIITDTAHVQPRIRIVAKDTRGLLYGIGRLLRGVDWSSGEAVLAEPLDVRNAPACPLRGHQLGYRHTANSYDAWTPAQYEQYIRDLVLFGCNAIENIPFQDSDSPHMPSTREVMNIEMSRICDKYDLEYWVWSPATFGLADKEKRAAHLDMHREFFAKTPRLDAVFFPGGDPGDNHPREVMPFLAELADILAAHHPEAGIWISLQGFDPARVNYFYDWVKEHMPGWLEGVVAGPGSPPIPETRQRLRSKYKLRHYPDITHTVRSQYPTPWWDPAYAFTLGREPVNPEPVRYAQVHDHFAPYTDGFIAYSDGIHDDVNKFIWLARAMAPSASVRQTLIEYARVFLPQAEPTAAADAILALERNWQGGLAQNSGVDGTLALWQRLETAYPELLDNWRFQAHLMRAYYDAYTRHRLLFETRLEAEALAALDVPQDTQPASAMDEALAILARAETDRVHPEWRARVFELCQALFERIGLQTSVEKYQARGGERGAVLDYIDVPLNNRWYIEDQFAEIRALDDPAAQWERLETLRTWADPGPGGFYDNVGHVGQSPNVVRGEQPNTDPNNERSPNPDCMWWDNGFTRTRHAWVSYMDWPLGVYYTGLDPQASYVVQTTGNRKCLLRADGEQIEPDKPLTGIGEKKTFIIPGNLTQDGDLCITFDTPVEPGINWRDASRLTEIWLRKRVEAGDML